MADLELNKIAKSFGGVVALSAASLHCYRGEVHGLVGQNGAGKSTLVKTLSGVLRSDSGTIMLFGQPLRIGSPADAVRAGIGMVFQELSLIPDLTVAANIYFGHEQLDPLGGISQNRLRRASLELFERMGVTPIDPSAEVRDLPLAQRQMVEIAKVLARDPKVIILDEATSALGRKDADWLLGYSRTLANEGRIIIYITHNLREIRHVSDRITVYRNGQDVGVCDPATTSTDELVDLILGRRASRLYPPRGTPIGNETPLEVRDLSGGRRLNGVSFKLRQGEILGIGGLTGQGQDELFRGLYGMLRTTGEIAVNGRPTHITNPQRALGQGIQLALVPEDRSTQGLVAPMSVAHNLSMAVLPQLLRWGLIAGAAENALVSNMVGRLSIKVGDLTAPVMRLSGGNQQKVVLGKLLAARPRILLLYDCTRGVDVGTKAEIFQLLRDLSAQGSSILLYSTDVDELIKMADRVLVMRQGQIEAELSGATQTEENIIRASMGEPIKQSADGGMPTGAAVTQVM
jgi:ribose transport system ATP-binding protein